ncbi:MAG TPA: aspartate aminotransferase family protein [Candidatus Limnocylindrales bacterium]|jgi:4-aminobutyrate aminotransferase|nr:aspartate aminotransferase family protein [Candidatus Limnocylindrales bacterium]
MSNLEKKESDQVGLRSEGDVNLSQNRRVWATEHVDAATRKLLDDDARYFLHQSLSTPCLNVLKASAGASITDLQGRELLDFHGNSVHQVGFGNPRVIEAIIKQLRELPFCPRRYTNVPAINLARKLAELAPGDLNRVLFAPGGTVAIGMAIKLARAATGRHKMISMWDSFHGASLDAISVGGEAVFRRDSGPLLPGCEHVPPPDSWHCPWDCRGSCSLKCADYIEYVLEKEGDVAAVIGETVRNIPLVPPPDYWRKVRAACDKHGALLILDEIPTGLGRTGRMFACEHYGIVPDMLVLGKALGGGIMPIAALLAREHLNVAADRAIGHYTHEKSPVAAAAALATIDFIESENLLEKTREMSAFALAQLEKMKQRHPIIGDVRGLGLILGVELVRDRKTMERHSDAADRVMYDALSRGLSFKVAMGNVLLLAPALTITRKEMQRALKILEESIAVMTGKEKQARRALKR